MLLIQLGVGQVGTAVVSEVQRLARTLAGAVQPGDELLGACGLQWLCRPRRPSRTHAHSRALASVVQAHASGQPWPRCRHSRPSTDWQDVLEQAILAAGGADRVIVVDCAVGHGTTDLLLAARAAGAHIVLCNKDPLTGPYHQFEALQGAGGHGSLHLTATVGAGLPITGAVAAAAASGDTVIALRAVASGSLGQLCASMSAGATFPDALQSAIERGYCEPDPRVDLSGYDVARKLLILARLAGYPAEIADVAVESLIPAGGAALSRDDFLAALPSWRDHLRDRVATARASSHALRYVGAMDAQGANGRQSARDQTRTSHSHGGRGQRISLCCAPSATSDTHSSSLAQARASPSPRAPSSATSCVPLARLMAAC